MSLKFAKTKRKKRGDVEDKLWRVFSQYIRLRDSNDYGWCVCSTCGRPHHWKDIDAGHFMGREHKATKFHEKNVVAQCRKCNSFEAGQQYRMSLYIDKRFGDGTAKMLEELSRVTIKTNKAEMEELIPYYRAKVKEMKKAKLLS